MTARPRRRKGFTLVEVLCVVVILGILAAMVLPQVSNNPDLDAAAGARQLMGDLMYAQNQAIATQKYVYVTFDASGQTYSVCSSMNPLTYLNDPIEQTQFTRTFGSGGGALAACTLESANFGSGTTTIAYDPLGEPCAYAGSAPPPPATYNGAIEIASGSAQLTINIEADSGELSVQ